MNILDIVLLFVIVLSMLALFKTPKREPFNNGCLEDKNDNYYLNELVKLSTDELDKFINPVFVEGQFHTDYRDAITAFNNMSSGKQIFNQANVPIEFNNPSK